MVLLHILQAVIVLVLTVPSGRKWRMLWSRYLQN